jgi:hypothetical protein
MSEKGEMTLNANHDEIFEKGARSLREKCRKRSRRPCILGRPAKKAARIPRFALYTISIIQLLLCTVFPSTENLITSERRRTRITPCSSLHVKHRLYL